MFKMDQVHNIDCLEGLTDIPSNTFDAIVTSPPYFCMGEGAWKSSENYVNYMSNRFSRALDTLTMDGLMFLSISDIEPLRVPWRIISKLVDQSGYSYFGEMIWDKTHNEHESIYVLGKRDLPNLKRIHGIYSFGKQNTISFPEKLVDHCLSITGKSSGNVLDPFMGYGTTGVVAKKNGWHFMGFEIHYDICAAANEQIRRIDK